MRPKHLQPHQLRSLDKPPVPSHIRVRILDNLREQQIKQQQRQQDIRLANFIASSFSLGATSLFLWNHLTQSDFGNLLQTIALNYQHISAASVWLAILENLPFGSLALVLSSAAWFTLSFPKHPLISIRHITSSTLLHK